MNVQDVGQSQESTGKAQIQPIDLKEYREYCELSMQEPPWREVANKACDYIDGNQLSAADRAILKSRGLPDISANLMQPVINVVLGMEEKARLDWRVVSDGSSTQDVAEGLSQKMKEAERESGSDRATSDAYSSQIRSGVGWVYVGPQKDPFRYWLRVNNVHRREIWWDWRDQSPTLEDASWQIRKKRFDINHIASFFPGKEELIRNYGAGWDNPYLMESSGIDQAQADEFERSFSLADFEMRDPYRKTVLATEVAYRRWCRGYVLRIEDRVVELNMQNQMHLALVASGRIQPEPAVYSKVFRSLWVGPIKLSDVPYRNRRLPYIPFFGYREDLTGAPYGLGKPMMPLQDEINARRRKLLHLLSAKTLISDSDALDQQVNDLAQVLEEVSRPDAAIMLNPDRRNRDANAFRIETHGELSHQQMQVMEESKQALQQVVGVFNAMLGREQTAQSGVAISGLVEQATTGLAEINGNYRFSRQEVGAAILDEVRARIGQAVTPIEIGERANKRIIVLNNPVQDPQTGMTVLENDVQRSKARLALSDVPSTPAYRQEQVRMITEVTRGAAPEIQAAMAPFLIEMTDVGARFDMADAVRDALGMPPPMSQEDRAAGQAQAQAKMSQQQALQERLLIAQVEKAEFEAQEAKAKAMQAELEVGVIVQDSELKQKNEQRAQAQEIRDNARAMREHAKGFRDQQSHDLQAIQGLSALTEERKEKKK